MKKKNILIIISFITLFLCESPAIIAQVNNKSKLQQFENAITQAEEYLKAKEYAKAKAEYQKALSINPGAKYPKDKLVEIRNVFIDPQDEVKFKEAIDQGDNLLIQKNFTAAKEQYSIAVNIKPEDRLARDKMLSADKLTKEHDLKRKEYSVLIEKADKLFDAKDYYGARSLYEQAVSQNSDERHPLARIIEIDGILSTQKDIDDRYNQHVQDADDAYMNRDFKLAISKYNEALKIKPAESYPKNMIARVEESFTTHQKNNLAYESLILEADQLYNKKDYSSAITAYQDALKLLPDEKYPAEKISMASSILLTEKDIDVKYSKAVIAGDQFVEDNNIEEALKSYQQASLIKPDETYPKQKVEEINNQLIDHRNKIESRYSDAIKQADQHYTNEEYEKAIEFYQIALSIKENEQYPKEAIEKATVSRKAKIQKEIEFEEVLVKADKSYDLKDYENALSDYKRAAILQPSNNHVESRLISVNEIILTNKEKSEQYTRLITEADRVSNSGQLEEAFMKYNEVIALFPGEEYPKTKVNEIITSIENKKVLETKLAEEKKSNEAKLNQLFADAEKLMAKNDYNNALINYKLLQQERPTDEKVNARINQINEKLKALNEQESQYNNAIQKGEQYLASNEYALAETEFRSALRLKPEDFYSRSKLDEISRIIEENKLLAAKQATEKQIKEARLKQNIAEADALFAKNDLVNAFAKYKSVLLESPDDQHIIDMIKKIEDKNKENEVLNTDYANAIKNGDRYLEDRQFALAEVEFKRAMELKPVEAMPKQKLADVARLAEESRKLESRKADEAKAVQVEFKRLVQLADGYYNNKDFATARTTYSNAANLNSSDEYVKGRINEITSILDQQEYETNKNYINAIEKASQFFKEGDYRSAIVQFEIASKAKPLERLPKDKLLEINSILIERSKNNLALYNKLILMADEYYQTRVFDKALEEYEKASAAYPGEQYPLKMITRIKKEIEERAIVELANNPFSLLAGVEKRFTFKSIEMRARKNNYILIKAKKTSEKPPKVFINYGVDSQKSGGIVVKGIDSNDTREYILRISIQDMWYRKDNNWISLYSEGGDVEITSLQISQGDTINIQ